MDADLNDDHNEQIEAYLRGLPPLQMPNPDSEDDDFYSNWGEVLGAVWETLPEFLVGLGLSGRPEVVRYEVPIMFERYDGIRNTVGNQDSLTVGEAEGAVILTYTHDRDPDENFELGAEVFNVHEVADPDKFREGLRTAIQMMVAFGNGATPEVLGLVSVT